MTLPFLVTLVLTVKDGKRHTFSLSGKIGLAVAVLSLGLAWKPVSDGLTRSKQVKNLAMRDVAAPPFDTVDILGKTQRLGDHKGEVVLINIWATWCGPCRNEMPNLDQLYQGRKQEGFTVFGLSDESVRFPLASMVRMRRSFMSKDLRICPGEIGGQYHSQSPAF